MIQIHIKQLKKLIKKRARTKNNCIRKRARRKNKYYRKK